MALQPPPMALRLVECCVSSDQSRLPNRDLVIAGLRDACRLAKEPLAAALSAGCPECQSSAMEVTSAEVGRAAAPAARCMLSSRCPSGPDPAVLIHGQPYVLSTRPVWACAPIRHENRGEGLIVTLAGYPVPLFHPPNA